MGIFGLSLPKKKDVQNVFNTIGRGASRIYDQANMFDNGLSYQTRQVQGPRRSVASQYVRPIEQMGASRIGQNINAAGEMIGGSSVRQATRMMPMAFKPFGLPGLLAESAMKTPINSFVTNNLEDDLSITNNPNATPGRIFGRGVNLARDIAPVVLPGVGADRAVRASSLIQNAPRFIQRGAPRVADSLASSGAFAVRNDAAGMEQNVPRDLALGLAADLATFGAAKVLRPMAAPAVRVLRQGTGAAIDAAGNVIRGAGDQLRRFNLSETGYVSGQSATGFADAERAGRVFVGPDGKKRFEVSDDKASLVAPRSDGVDPFDSDFYGEEFKMSNLLDHPKLYEQYPELRNVKVISDDRLPEGTGGSWDGQVMRINPYEHTDDESIIKTIMHEMQHVIQRKEGFARGGSVDKKQVYDELRDEQKRLFDSLDDGNGNIRVDKNPADDAIWKRIMEIDKIISNRGNIANKAFANYRRLGGEAESRAVEKRLRMTDAERQKKGFYSSLDVPKKDLRIVTPAPYKKIEVGKVTRGPTPKRIHPEDQNIMSDFIDFARGRYRPGEAAGLRLQEDAAKIAERYGLDMPNNVKGLADVFDKRLSQEGFGASLSVKKAPKVEKKPGTVRKPKEAVGYKSLEELEAARAKGTLKTVVQHEDPITGDIKSFNNKADADQYHKWLNSPAGMKYRESYLAAKKAKEAAAKKPVTVKKDKPPKKPPVEPPKKTVRVRKTKDTPSVEEAVYGTNIPEASTAPGKSRVLGISRGGSPIIKVTRGIQKGINNLADKALSSGNVLAYAPARTAQNLFGSIGKTDAAQTAVSRYKGETGLGTDMGLTVEKQVSKGRANKALNYDNPEVRQRLVDALDPEVARVRDPGSKPPKLSPVEAAAVKRLREVADAAHEEAHRLGIISDEAYEKNKGSYLTRIQQKYEFPEDMQNHWKRNGLRPPDELTKHRQELTGKLLYGQIDDPVYSVSKQLDFLQRNKAIRNFADNISKQKGLVSDEKKIGFVQLGDSPTYGPLAGKYLRRDMYESIMGFGAQSETLGAVYKLLNAWERNILRRSAKKATTIYNPGVRIANALYNGVIEANLGISPQEMAAGHVWARRVENSKNPEVLMLRKAGILNSDILSQEIKGRARVRATQETRNIAKKAIKLIKGVDDYVGDSYGRVDDRGKLAAYHALTKQGFSQAEAMNRVSRAFQDYSSVGKFWDISAKTPIFGKAFGRFTGDFVRRATNLAVDKPLTSISMLAGLYTVGNVLSKAQGEDPEDRETRENRVGAGKFPFTDISTELQTPWGAVDVRRFLGPSVINDMNGGPLEGSLTALSPFDNPIAKNQAGETEVSAKAFGSDPLLGPVVQQGLNRDFRQKPITDPDYFKQTQSGGLLGQEEPLDNEQKKSNRLKTLARSYTPPVGQTYSDYRAAQEGKPDFYGREKSPGQALLRGVGVRVEQYGADKAQKARDVERYHKVERPALDAIKNKYFKGDPNLKNSWETLHPKSKDRYGNEIYPESLLNPQKRAMTYLSEPRLLALDREIAVQQNKNDGKPVDPLLTLEPTQQRSVLLAQGYYQGNGGDEKKVMLYSQPWYDKFRQAREKYFDERREYYKSQGFVDQGKDNDDDGYPKASKALQSKMEQFNSLTEGKAEFLRQNPDAKQYLDDIRAWKNAWRIKVGLPPQDTYGNVIDPRTGESLGGGFGRGGGRPAPFNPAEYLKKYSIGGDVRKGTTTASARPKVTVRSKRTGSGKIRVTSRKIRMA